MYPSLKEFENKVVNNQQKTIHVAYSASLTSIDNLLTEDQDLSTDLAVKEQLQQAVALYLLASVANFHALMQQYKDYTDDTSNPFQRPKLSAYAELWNPLQKMNHILYLYTYILDICATLQDLLQARYSQISLLFTSC